MTTQQQPTTRRVPCLIYSRVVGYISLAQHGGEYMWNKGKAREWQDRVTYAVPTRERMEESPDA